MTIRPTSCSRAAPFPMNRRPSNFLVNRRTDLKIASTCLGILLFAAAGAARAEIVLYENDDFNGRTYSSFNSVSNLGDSGFNDRASSVRIRGGRWQLCADAYFRGNCVTLGPGEYRSLRAMGMNDKLSSARELGWTPDGGGGWNSNNRYDHNNQGSYNNNSSYDSNQWGNGGNWGAGARVVLYEDIGLKGRTFVVSAGGVPNLKGTGFNNTASSLRIESGYWLFCSEPNYQGDCRTFGPGDHRSMPSGFNDRISSGRQVTNNYPYRSNPNWSGN